MYIKNRCFISTEKRTSCGPMRPLDDWLQKGSDSLPWAIRVYMICWWVSPCLVVWNMVDIWLIYIYIVEILFIYGWYMDNPYSDWWVGTALFIFHCSIQLGIIIPTDSYFAEGVKPPIRSFLSRDITSTDVCWFVSPSVSLISPCVCLLCVINIWPKLPCRLQERYQRDQIRPNSPNVLLYLVEISTSI